MWKRITTATIFKNKYFELREDQCEMPTGKIVPRYFVMDFPDWVLAVAIDRQKMMVMVEQYRYPGGGSYLEFPGGSTMPSRDEDPLLAAKRELREETGYVSEKWQSVGSFYPNPALMSNRCHVFLALDCDRVGEPNLDPFEEIKVSLAPIENILSQVPGDVPQHALMLAATQLVRPHLEKLF